MVALLLSTLLTIGQAGPTPTLEPGLYSYSFGAAGLQRIGAWHNPSADVAGGWLYVDDGQGGIFRWRADNLVAAPQPFFATPEGETRRAVPLASNPAGLVVLTRNDPVKQGATLLYERVSIEVYDRNATKLAGPLPLVRRDAIAHPSQVAVWQPEGPEPSLAFNLTEGNSKPGLYVFQPRTKQKNWILAESYAAGVPSPLPSLSWQPNGRTLAVIVGGRVELRGGGSFATYKSFATDASRVLWPNSDSFGLLDPAKGVELRDFEGRVTKRIDAWRAGNVDELSVPACGPKGWTWVEPAGQGMLALRHLKPGAAQPDTLVTFPKGRVPYAQQCSPPLWHPVREAVLFEVPAPAPKP